jgi:hypothetical protein
MQNKDTMIDSRPVAGVEKRRRRCQSISDVTFECWDEGSPNGLLGQSGPGLLEEVPPSEQGNELGLGDRRS